MRTWAAAIACLGAAACTTPAPVDTSASTPGRAAPSGAVESTASRSYAEDLVDYLARLRTMNEASLGAEAARMRRDASDLARVKAALALSLAREADENEVIELVDPVLRKAGSDRDVRAMAAFLHATSTERRRLKQRAAAAQGEAREERKVAEAQKQRAEQLQQKLDALTELEKSLAARDSQVR